MEFILEADAWIGAAKQFLQRWPLPPNGFQSGRNACLVGAQESHR